MRPIDRYDALSALHTALKERQYPPRTTPEALSVTTVAQSSTPQFDEEITDSRALKDHPSQHYTVSAYATLHGLAVGER